jgi:tellurite methyltransferase
VQPVADPRLLPEHRAWRAGNVLDVRPEADYIRGHAAPAVSLLLPAGILAQGSSRRHLWRPPPFLVGNVHRLPPPAAGPVLELGAGSCRASVWLAEQGWRVTAVDRDALTLELGRRLADDSGVNLITLQRDLRDPARVPPGPWAVVLAIRFLPRAVLRALPDLLQPHGVAVVRTFRASAGLGADRGPRRPRHRLAPGELLRLFPAEQYDVLVHEQDHDPDGLPMAGVVARRRPGESRPGRHPAGSTP